MEREEVQPLPATRSNPRGSHNEQPAHHSYLRLLEDG